MLTPHPYFNSWAQRLFDILGVIAISFVVIPLVFFLALYTYFSSGWPVIFTQKRVGYHKKVFTLYKLRTMHRSAEKNQKRFRHLSHAPHPFFKISNDPRFVGIGRWLSKTGLDELPQILNILKGEMSFIGPRPLPVAEAAKLDASWDFRYMVKPGIFSAWSAAMQSHTSLKKWKELEQKTLQQAGVLVSFSTILHTILTILFYSLADIRNFIVRKLRIQR